MTVRIEATGPVRTIILSRPAHRNAVDLQAASELADAFRTFENDAEALVAVLWGEGGHFCAGADLKAVARGTPNRVAPDGDGPMGPTRLSLSKPVIAAIEGYAVAGGLELAIWCDLRVVAEDAVFGVFCRRFGVPLIDGGTVRLPRLIGQSHAMDMILTGRPVTADEALGMGLANRVVTAGETRQVAEEMARNIASHPQNCLRSDRASCLNQWSLPVADAMAQELQMGTAVLQIEAFPGAQRFAEGYGRHGRFENDNE